MKASSSFSRRFLSICLGISMVLLCGSAFLFSLNTARAEVNLPPSYLNLPQQAPQGRYQVSMVGFKNDQEYDFYILKFDTETGAGDMFWYDRRENTMNRWEEADVPAGPVGE